MDNYTDYNIDIPAGKTTGEITTTCPKCSADRKKSKTKCLGINLDKAVWNCLHCGFAGCLKAYETEAVKVFETPPWNNKTDLSENAVKWFEGRGINQKTLLEMKITEGKEYMPQIQKETNTLQFNFFRNGSLVNTKYRDAVKNFKLYKGAERIFYNLDVIHAHDDVFIVEGEVDCLSLIESGLKNVISVPNGANLNSNNLEYLDSSIGLFENKQIHLALDADTAGRKLREDIAERFGKDRCDHIIFKDCKDANECLQKYGIQGIIDSCANPIEFPLEGSFTISDIRDEIGDMYKNGLDMGADLHIENFRLNIAKGYITTITGIPGMGKSEWVDNMCIQLKLHHDWSGAFYSPENKPTQLHFSKMARKLVGKHWDFENRMSLDEVNEVADYLDKKFWFIKPEKDFSLTSILESIRILQKRHGLDFFVIDAWNKLSHKDTNSDSIGRSLDLLANFCEVNNLHCFLVAHPRKMGKNKDTGQYDVPTLYDIKNASEFFDKTDNGLCIYRDYEKQQAIVYIQKVKFDHWGTVGYSEYAFDKPSLRYYQGIPDKTNWMTQKKSLDELNVEQGNFFDEGNSVPVIHPDTYTQSTDEVGFDEKF